MRGRERKRGRWEGQENGKEVFPVERYVRLPLAGAGQRIGLLGGSFDPPHKGHVHISLEAIKRCRLDYIWWLVSPGNPLKTSAPWPLATRLQQCLELVDHPKIRITAFEAVLGSPYTAKTLKYLTRRLPSCHFVWLMGGDNMTGVHLWQDWRSIFEMVPVGVLDRPGANCRINSSRAAHLFASGRLGQRSAAALAAGKPPLWCRLSLPLSHESSTRIREKYRN